jgi:polynucleotide 5'-kinase involved in rRNA processing
MIRTQIQLRDSQVRALKKLAKRNHVSVAEVIRRSVDHIINTSDYIDDEKQKAKAIHVVGKFHSGKSDISKEHDEYLSEDFN